jgi:hypothetical protein
MKTALELKKITDDVFQAHRQDKENLDRADQYVQGILSKCEKAAETGAYHCEVGLGSRTGPDIETFLHTYHLELVAKKLSELGFLLSNPIFKDEIKYVDVSWGKFPQ